MRNGDLNNQPVSSSSESRTAVEWLHSQETAEELGGFASLSFPPALRPEFRTGGKVEDALFHAQRKSHHLIDGQPHRHYPHGIRVHLAEYSPKTVDRLRHIKRQYLRSTSTEEGTSTTVPPVNSTVHTPGEISSEKEKRRPPFFYIFRLTKNLEPTECI